MSKSTFFAGTELDKKSVDAVTSLVRHLEHQYDNGQLMAQVNKGFSRNAVATESLNQDQRQEMATTIGQLKVSMESAIHAMAQEGHTLVPTLSQQKAAIAAAALAGDVKTSMNRPGIAPVPALESNKRYMPAQGDFLKDRGNLGLEAYDERENKATVVYSMAYNMLVARQDEFGETLFQTVALSPDQFSLTNAIRLVQVYNEVQRSQSGDADDFGKRNIIRAVIDPTILANDQTNVVPVYSDDSKKYFVSDTLLPTRTVKLGDEDIVTSALAIGKEFSLLGLSQTAALLRTGFLDSTDALDTYILLKTVYIQIGTGNAAEVIAFPVSKLNTSNFTHSVQGNYRLMNLAFKTKSLMINKNIKKVDGTASTILAPIVTASDEVRLSLSLFGSVNTELGTTQVTGGDLSVFNVVDVNGDELSLTAGNGATIAALFAGAKVLGYDLEARRTNSNRRERGQLLDITYEKMEYGVPLLPPITVLRPTAIGDQNDATDLAALVSTTHIRASIAAVDEFLKTADILKAVTSQNTPEDYNPDLLGVAHFLVNPFYEEHELEVDASMDSLKSHERAADIQATLINLIRDVAIRMWRNSGYKAAADALAGGVAEKPTIIIATDQYLERYLNIFGDTRLLGDTFDVRVVSTQNIRMRGKIGLTLGCFNAAAEGAPNPMTYGNMALKPELTYILPTHRNGANNKEVTVAPSFRHFVNLPIQAMINVTGIETVVKTKTVIKTEDVTP